MESNEISGENDVFQKQRNIDVEYCLSYYETVKNHLQENTELWSQFLDVVKVMNSKCNPCVVYSRIQHILQDYPDLLAGFESFMPKKFKECYLQDEPEYIKIRTTNRPVFIPSANTELKSSFPLDESMSHVAKYGGYKDLHFFDKFKKALVYPEVYNNFLHCIQLYVDDNVTVSELIEAVSPFFVRLPELFNEFKDMIHYDENIESFEIIPSNVAQRKELDEETELDIDYNSGKRKNASYKPISKTTLQPLCSGRTPLCDEVLNDTWVSFPAWSEDSTFGASPKTKFDEHVYRIEDERFELDMAIQTNASLIDILHKEQLKIGRLSDEERCSYTLDNTLGGHSPALIFRFIHRIYGDRTKDLMEGLMRNPVVAVPIVLNRLRVREREWKDAQANYNVIWKDQMKRYYLKSLDHQGVHFKQNDAKILKPKYLLNEIETAYEETFQNRLDGYADVRREPHIVNQIVDLRILSDATNLIYQDIKKQSSISRDDRRYMLDILCFFIPGFFKWHLEAFPNTSKEVKKRKVHSTVVDLESDSDEDDDSLDMCAIISSQGKKLYASLGLSQSKLKSFKDLEKRFAYSFFFVNNNWYILFRLLSLLLTRLTNLFQESLKIETERQQKGNCSRAASVSPYFTMLEKVALLVCGKIDSSRFDDEMRETFVTHAYMSYTFDKVVHAIVKQLQLITSDDISKTCMEYYIQEILDLESMTSFQLLNYKIDIYEKKVSMLIGEENSYEILWNEREGRLAFTLLDCAKELSDRQINTELSDYLDKYVDRNHVDYYMPFSTIQMPVFLKRTLRKQKTYWHKMSRNYLHGFGTYKRHFGSRNYVPLRNVKRKNFGSDSEKTKKKKKVKKESPEEKEFVFAKPKDVSFASMSFTTLSDNHTIVSDSFTNCMESRTHHTHTHVTNVYSHLEDSGVIVRKTREQVLIQQEPSMVDQLVASETEEEEDYINISAKDLFLHLTQTGMTVFDNFHDPFQLNKESLSTFETVDTSQEKSNNTETFLINPENDQSDEFHLNKNITNTENLVESTAIKGNLEEIANDGIKLCVNTQNQIFNDVFDSNPENDTKIQKIQETCIDSKNSPADSLSRPELETVILNENQVYFIDPNNPDVYQDEITGSNIMLASECEITQEETLCEVEDSSFDKSENPSEISETLPVVTCVYEDHNNSDDLIAVDQDNSLNEQMDILQLSLQNTLCKDNMRCVFDLKTFKMRFCAGSFHFLYRIGSFGKAKKIHKAISLKRSEKFSSWHRSWLDTFVTPSMLKLSHDWLFRGDSDKYRVECITVNEQSKPPYGPFTKYQVTTHRRSRRR